MKRGKYLIKQGQLIEVKISSVSKKYYENRGYKCKRGDVIYVSPEHLPNGSQKKIWVICDIGGEEFYIQYRYYVQNIKKNKGKYICQKCLFKDEEYLNKRNKKREETCLEKYGVTNTSVLESTKEKTKQTCLDKYGVPYTTQVEDFKEKKIATFQKKYGTNSALEVTEFLEKSKATCKEHYGVLNPQQSDLIKEKTKQTNLERYGTSMALQNPQIKEKAKQTCLNNWGVEYSLSSLEIREKGKKTMLDKFGVENAGQSKELQAKARKTMFKHGKTRTSKQQKKIYDVLKNKYNNCFLNYPLGKYSLDCVIETEQGKIDIEYDGWYWHNKVLNKEKDDERDIFVQSNGYKVLRIKAGKNIPNENLLLESINNLLNSDKWYLEIVLPEWEQNTKEDC